MFHPNGRFMLSVSDDHSIRTWDLNNGRCYDKIMSAHSNFVQSIDIRQGVCVTGSCD